MKKYSSPMFREDKVEENVGEKKKSTGTMWKILLKMLMRGYVHFTNTVLMPVFHLNFLKDV